MSCRLLRTLHWRHLLLKTLRPLLVRLRRHLLGPGVVLLLWHLLVRLLISLLVLLRELLAISQWRHLLIWISLLIRLVTHLLATRRPRRLLHCGCILIRQRHGLWHVWWHRHRCRLGLLRRKHSGLLHLSHGGLHLRRRHGLLRKSSRQGICGLLRLGPHGGTASTGALDLLHTFGVEAYGYDGAVAHIVLDRYRPAGVFQVLLHHGETGSSAADISFHTAICAGYAKVEGALLVVDARPLVGKANGVAPHRGWR